MCRQFDVAKEITQLLFATDLPEKHALPPFDAKDGHGMLSHRSNVLSSTCVHE